MAVKKNNTAIKNSPKHLLGIQNLSILEAKAILDEAKKFIELNSAKIVKPYEYMGHVCDDHYSKYGAKYISNVIIKLINKN